MSREFDDAPDLDNDGIDEGSIYDETEDEAIWSAPSAIDPLLPITLGPSASLPGFWAGPSFRVGEIRAYERFAPKTVMEGLWQNLLYRSAAALVTASYGHVTATEAAMGRMLALDGAKPEVSRAISVAADLQRHLARPGDRSSWLKVLDQLAGDGASGSLASALRAGGPGALADGLGELERLLEGLDEAGSDNTRTTVVEAVGLAAAFDLNRPLLLRTSPAETLSDRLHAKVNERAKDVVEKIGTLLVAWDRLPPLPRSGRPSAIRQCAELAVGSMMVSVPWLVKETGLDKSTVTRAVAQLEEDGFLRELTGRRNWRVWKCV